MKGRTDGTNFSYSRGHETSRKPESNHLLDGLLVEHIVINVSLVYAGEVKTLIMFFYLIHF